MKPIPALAVLLGFALATAAQGQAPHEHAPHAPHPPVAADARVVLPLTPEERAMVLEEMRMFLAGVQQITGALGREDMPAVAEVARGLGQQMVHEVPPALRAKLPQEFRQLGFSVHRDFDQIALDADTLKDASHGLSQLSSTLQTCVACHAGYQIQSPLHSAIR